MNIINKTYSIEVCVHLSFALILLNTLKANVRFASSVWEHFRELRGVFFERKD